MPQDCADSVHNEPLAIVGMACRLPGGVSSPSELWTKLLNGDSCRGEIPISRFNKSAFYHPDSQHPGGGINAPAGYFIDQDVANFDNEFFNINNLEARYMDPQQRQLLEVSYECLESAGIPLKNVSGLEIGCFVANFTSDFSIIQAKDPELYHRYSATGIGTSILANRISHVFNLKGPSVTIDTACSASIYALNLACSALRQRECDGAIIGAANLILTPEPYSCAVKAGMTSGTAQCHTFDASADGYARAEGVGVLYVKRLSDAIRDGDSIRSVIRGIAVNSNGNTNGISLPSADGQEAVIRKAYSNANLDVYNTDYVELHGTGTQVGDSIEVEATSRVLKHHTGRPSLVGSIKTNVGHGEAVSGISAIIKVTLALEHGIIPASIGVETINPQLNLVENNVRIVTTSTKWPDTAVPRASINSFGFGGSNGHVVLEASPRCATPVLNGVCRSKRENRVLLPMSARSHDALQGRQDGLLKYVIETSPEPTNLAFTLSCRRAHLSRRSFIILEPDASREDQLSNFANQPPQLKESPSSFHFIYTGQGAQWSGMGASLLRMFPIFSGTIDKLTAHLSQLKDGPSWDLRDVMTQTNDQGLIHNVAISQTACTALQIGLTDLLKSLQMSPAIVIGHSSGEIGAAYAAGILSAKQAIATAYYRGMAVCEVSSDGAMAVVGTSPSTVTRYIQTSGLEGKVAIACINSRSNVTVSGDANAIDRFVDLAASDQHFVRRLQTGGKAYHSSHMGSIGRRYERLLEEILPGTLKKGFAPLCRVFSSLTGKELLGSEMYSPSYWRENLESPVLFEESMIKAVGQEERMLVEIGPHNALRSPCIDIHQGLNKPCTYYPTLTRNREPEATILELVGHTFLQGHDQPIERLNCSDQYNTKHPLRPLHDLPRYKWDHGTTLWNEGRTSLEYRQRKFPRHDLLGLLIPGGSGLKYSWRNIIRPIDVPWLQDHKLGDTIVFPAAGYIVMSLEALRQSTSEPDSVKYAVLKDVRFLNFLTFPDTKSGAEVFTELEFVPNSSKSASRTDRFFVISSFEHGVSTIHARGIVSIDSTRESISGTDLIPAPLKSELGKTDIWYDALNREGHNFGPAFRALSGVSEAVGADSQLAAHLSTPHLSDEWRAASLYPVHPTTVDMIFQTMLISCAEGSPSKLRGKVPSSLKLARFDLALPAAAPERILTSSRFGSMHNGLCDSQLVNHEGHLLIQMQDLELVPWRRRSKDEAAYNRSPLLEVKWTPVMTATPRIQQKCKLERFDGDLISSAATSSVPQWFQHSVSALKLFAAARPGALHLLCLQPPKSFVQEYLLSQFAFDSPLRSVRSFAAGRIQNDSLEVTLRLPETQLLTTVDGCSQFDLILCSGSETVDDLKNISQFLSQSGRLIVPSAAILSDRLPAPALAEDNPLSSESSLVKVFRKVNPELGLTNNVSKRVFTWIYTSRRQGLDSLQRILPELLPERMNAEIHQITLEEVLDQPSLIPTGAEVICTCEFGTPFVASMGQREFQALQTITQRASVIVWLQAAGPTHQSDPSMSLIRGLSRSLAMEQASLKFVTFQTGTCAGDIDLQQIVADLEFILHETVHNEKPDTEYTQIDGVLHTSRVAPICPLNDRFVARLLNLPTTRTLNEVGHAQLYLQQPGQFDAACFTPAQAEKDTLDDHHVEIKPKAYSINGKDYYTLKGNVNCQEATCSLDFSGIVTSVGAAVTKFEIGDRVVCMAPSQFGTFVRVPDWACSKLQNSESFKIMSTIPIVFSTAIHALYNLAKIKPGESVLIHSAAGGVGIAAIQVAQRAGAIIYATVGSESKKEYLIRTFGLEKDKIFSSRDSEFAASIRSCTSGRGLDVVLNSLTGDLLRVSWELVGEFGRFVDISKRDCVEGGIVSMGPFSRSATYYCFDLADLYWSKLPEKNEVWHNLLEQSLGLIRDSHARPVSPVESYSVSDVGKAFMRFGDSSRIGKVVVSLEDSGSQIQYLAPRYDTVLDPSKSYLLIGCFGGLGQVIAQWMVERGARHLTFMSRSGASTAAAVKLVRALESQGVVVQTIRGDVACLSDVQAVVSSMKEPIGGVVHAAMSLDEALFSNMTLQQWKKCVDPKVQGSWNLLQALQPHAASLSFFLLTSSVAGTVGLATESNYCAANSFLDHFTAYARTCGLPAVSLGLGILSGLGYVHERPEIEKMLLRKGITAYDRDEVLLLIDLALSADAPAHLVTGLELPALQALHRKGFDPLNSVFADPRTSLFLNALENAKAEVGDTAKVESSAEELQAELQHCLYNTSAQGTSKFDSVVESLVTAIFGSILILPRSDISASSKLAQYGMDSMLAAEYRSGIFKAFGVNVEIDGLLNGETTVGDIVGLIKEELRPAS